MRRSLGRGATSIERTGSWYANERIGFTDGEPAASMNASSGLRNDSSDVSAVLEPTSDRIEGVRPSSTAALCMLAFMVS